MGNISFDQSTLSRFYGDSPADFAEILGEYIKNLDETESSLKTAFKEGIASLQSSIHFNGSIFCYVGFPELTTAFLEFEEKCKIAEDINTLSIPFEEIIDKVKQSGNIARDEIKKLQENICN